MCYVVDMSPVVKAHYLPGDNDIDNICLCDPVTCMVMVMVRLMCRWIKLSTSKQRQSHNTTYVDPFNVKGINTHILLISTITTTLTSQQVFTATDALSPILQPITHIIFLISFGKRPDSRFVIFKLIVAADACVELVAAEVLNGDDVKGRVPVGALCYWSHRDAIHFWGHPSIPIGFCLCVGCHGCGEIDL
ncbi:hypothetical protein J1614_003199 [Plenodomus biglobosus]|nr:hypothetical protein J1614_003199 [Plenodomus biglobosus]